MQKKEIRWKTSLLSFFIYPCFFIFLISCDTGKDPVIPDPPDDTSDLTPGDISDKLVARIYFDATLSMQGFVVPGSTHYTRICPHLESVIVSGWKDETVDFFRFGERVEPIDRDTYLQVGYESFYQTDIGIKTYIEKVIENEDPLVNPQMEASSTPETGTETDVNDPSEEADEADSTENRLVVIVTDLFQDNGDINRLLPELKEKCIKKGIDVGLFGLRSQFDGTVYDIGIGEGSSMRYQGLRPFYLLVLGKHADIAHYFDKLIASGFSEVKTVICSRYLVDPLLSFDGAKIEKLDNLIRDTIAEKPDPRLKEYRITKRDKPSKISATLEYVSLSHVTPFDSDTLKPSVNAQHNFKTTGRSLDPREYLVVTSKISKNEISNELTVEFNLDSRSLRRRTVYLYEVTLRPRIDSYQVPKWCSEWDMGMERKGSQTLNLVNFVRGLTQTTVREHLPKIAQFYFFVEKR